MARMTSRHEDVNDADGKIKSEPNIEMAIGVCAHSLKPFCDKLIALGLKAGTDLAQPGASLSYTLLYRRCDGVLTPTIEEVGSGKFTNAISYDLMVFEGLQPNSEETEANEEVMRLVDMRRELRNIHDGARMVLKETARALMGYILTGVWNLEYGGDGVRDVPLSNGAVLESFWKALNTVSTVEPFLGYELIALFPGLSELSESDREALVVEMTDAANGKEQDLTLINKTLEHGLKTFRFKLPGAQVAEQVGATLRKG
ncbi:MAG: hypothetical protein M1504_00025 [Candidatus Marsarchaeota archaeon]|nr:hypothetical protein [Candidatus Marsarchaeota archaeon]